MKTLKIRIDFGFIINKTNLIILFLQVKRIELISSVWKTDNLPLIYTCLNKFYLTKKIALLKFLITCLEIFCSFFTIFT